MGNNKTHLKEQNDTVIENYMWLIELAEPILKDFCHQYSHKNLILSLADKDSSILTIEKSNDDKKTNILKKQIKFDIKDYNSLYICSVPIHDKEELTAYLILTGYKEDENDRLEENLYTISKVLKYMIEMYKAKKELEKSNNFLSFLTNASSDGMLSVDMDGIITFINPTGMRILNIEKNIIGKHITEAVDFEPTILNVLETHEGYVDKEFRLENKRGAIHFVKTAIPLKNENGEMVGVLDIFRNIDEVKSMVNKMTGAQAKYSIFNIIGESPEIQEVKKMIKLSGSNINPVLIQGESGTGKDIIAQAIHNFGARSNGPFVTVDCESLPRNLLESELFGYEEGSFTSHKTGGRPGKIEMAQGGTLFLNNVGYIPLDVQRKLINVLQQKSVIRTGGFNEIPIDVRVISSSNINLEEMVKDNNFREDLFIIVGAVIIRIPALRERDEDIDLITNQVLNQYNLINGTNKELSAEARFLLHTWYWPGNVRELENAIEYAYYLAKGNLILPEHLQSKITKAITKIKKNPLMTIKEAEATAVIKALEHTGGNVTQAAKILGIGRNTLYGKIKEYGL
ncbi:MAG: sigma 54-interacting transcriptional regulator [Sedimentibacter sp.]|uniref:sigma-54 interaction domain-containing protein n=1 Tax=Sedimentibacter sp. TaxID=1960295 RepID=UPI00298296BA|nr:sigma 54-interacting transcriptional regulator [Sedimentibacter sp.]MDW5299147.1 sigma 54-interacting transcriptional regulator [Sedimentibacter sp.]